MKILGREISPWTFLIISLLALVVCLVSMFGVFVDRSPASIRLGKFQFPGDGGIIAKGMECASAQPKQISSVDADTPIGRKGGNFNLLLDKTGNLSGLLVDGDPSLNPRRVCASDINTLQKIILVHNDSLGDLVFVKALQQIDLVRSGGFAEISYKQAWFSSGNDPRVLLTSRDASGSWDVFLCDAGVKMHKRYTLNPSRCTERLRRLAISIAYTGVDGVSYNGHK